MAYRVELTERAARDLECLYQTINAETSARAHAWFNRLERLILSLEDQPARGSVVPEDARFRHLLHGRKPNVYRVIYKIDEQNEVVTVLHVRHGRRDALASSDDES
jgi:toxin ParE1/3/4